MSDLIDRQKAIEALDFEIVHMTVFSNDDKNGTNPLAQYNKGLEDGIKAIRALPSAEPERISMVWKPAKGRPAYEKGVCSCGYVLSVLQRDFVYCPMCGARLEWE